MKTLIASVVLAATLAISSTGFAQSTAGRSASSSVTNEGTKFWLVSGASGKIDVNVVKSNTKVSVNLVDRYGHTLASKTITKGEDATRTRFDMSELPDGSYKVILIEGNQQQEKDFELNTQSVETVRTVSLS